MTAASPKAVLAKHTAVPIESDQTCQSVTSNHTTLLPLEVRAVNFAIGSTTLLKDINLTIENRKITALMGHNGAGKSLLIRVLHGILKPQSGSIEWNRQSVSNKSVRLQQSMVFQKPVLLRRSVAANIDYVLKLRKLSSKTRCNELLEAAGLIDKSKQPARSLSGGEQQRLAIARALATNPKVLLLDEPTANLDPNATAKIEKLIQKASQQLIKVIVVTHDVAQAQRVADDVVFLDNGKICEYSSASSFFSHPESQAGYAYISGYTQPKTL